MARSTRLFLALVIVAAILGGIWWWLIDAIRTGTMQTSGAPDEAITTISSIMGGAIGVVLVGGLAVVAMLRGRGR